MPGLKYSLPQKRLKSWHLGYSAQSQAHKGKKKKKNFNLIELNKQFWVPLASQGYPVMVCGMDAQGDRT